MTTTTQSNEYIRQMPDQLEEIVLDNIELRTKEIVELLAHQAAVMRISPPVLEDVYTAIRRGTECKRHFQAVTYAYAEDRTVDEMLNIFTRRVGRDVIGSGRYWRLRFENANAAMPATI